MNRRNFLSTTAIGAAFSAAQSSPAAPTGDYQPKKAVMKLGCQSTPTTEKRLQFFKRHSVKISAANRAPARTAIQASKSS